eukprot:scaffold11736_cov159-Ochromonas_danica.AAC.6
MSYITFFIVSGSEHPNIQNPYRWFSGKIPACHAGAPEFLGRSSDDLAALAASCKFVGQMIDCVSHQVIAGCCFSLPGRVAVPFRSFHYTPFILLPTHLQCFQDVFNQAQQTILESSLSLTAFHLQYLPNGLGWALSTRRFVGKGQRIGIYAGEMISASQARKRYSEIYDAKGENYVLSFKEEGLDFILTSNIDATQRGNISRFINHSCSPNTTVDLLRASSSEHSDDHLVLKVLGIPTLKALRDIFPWEQLTFNYGDAACDETQQSSDKKRCFDEMKQREGQDTGCGLDDRKPCLCGAKNCCGWLPNKKL